MFVTNDSNGPGAPRPVCPSGSVSHATEGGGWAAGGSCRVREAPVGPPGPATQLGLLRPGQGEAVASLLGKPWVLPLPSS